MRPTHFQRIETLNPDNKQAEADFHDLRLELGDDDRASQSKYYWAVDSWQTDFENKAIERSAGKHVLELGCFSGDMTVALAAGAAHVTGIDISPRATEVTLERASSEGLSNIETFVCDAERIELPDESVDVVYAAGVIHHVDVEKTVRQIHRILRPGGVAAFREPLAHNPLINAYRYFTPAARTEDEHPLTVSDLRLIRSVFPRTAIDYFGFFALGAIPFKNTTLGGPIRTLLNGMDRLLINNALLGRFAWQANIFAEKN